jgi:hypothetical protein
VKDFPTDFSCIRHAATLDLVGSYVENRFSTSPVHAKWKFPRGKTCQSLQCRQRLDFSSRSLAHGSPAKAHIDDKNDSDKTNYIRVSGVFPK